MESPGLFRSSVFLFPTENRAFPFLSFLVILLGAVTLRLQCEGGPVAEWGLILGDPWTPEGKSVRELPVGFPCGTSGPWTSIRAA